MFLFKKIVSPLLLPVPLCLELLLVGSFLLWFTRKQKAGKIFVSAGVAMLLLLSYTGVSGAILRPLERKYPPVDLAAAQEGGPVKWVVALSAGHISDPRVSIANRITSASLARLVEAVRVYKQLPGSKLILSGGKPFDQTADAEVMAEVARALGAGQQDLVLESESRDTGESARLIQPIVGNDPFVLVTSASHMPRSMALFRALGMNPIPAPTDYMAGQSQSTSPGDFFPSSEGLRKAERAFYEYLGAAWEKLRGGI